MNRPLLIPIAEAVIETFRCLTTSPGDVREVRILDAVEGSNPRAADFPRTLAGYFDNAEELAKALATVTHAKGWYITLNPVISDALSRACNRLIKAQGGGLTKADEVLRREWLPVDLDPIRVSGVSSSEEEHQAALQMAQKIAEDLRDLGFPEPVVADSGNGAHLMYPLNLPWNDRGLVEEFLKALAAKYSDEKVEVDTAVHDPGRIWKLYGTPACKGSDTAKRPHRMSQILSNPVRADVLGSHLLKSILASWGHHLGGSASCLPGDDSRHGCTPGMGPIDQALMRHWDDGDGQGYAAFPRAAKSPSVAEVMACHFPNAMATVKDDGARVWSIDCPWCHKRQKAYVIEFPDHRGFASCHSTHCKGHGKEGKGWVDLLKLFAPVTEVHDQPRPTNRAGSSQGIFDCHSWSDLAAMPDEDQEYVLETMIPKGYAGIMAAPPGLGKTMWAIQVMVAKATGLPAFGLETGTPEGCLLVEFEQSPLSIKNRIKSSICLYGDAWTDQHTKLLEANFQLLTLACPDADDQIMSMDTYLEGCLPAIENVTKELGRVAWVAVDTLAWVSNGNAETDHLASRPLWGMALQFSRKYGCALTFIHHTRKSNKDQKLPDRMSPEMLRGANSQEGNARVINQIGWLTGEELDILGLPHGINPTREYGVFGLTKFNDGPLSEAWLLLRKSDKDGCGGCWEEVPKGSELMAQLLGATIVPRKPTQKSLILNVAQEAIKTGAAITYREIAEKVLGDPEKDNNVRVVIGRLKKDGILPNDWTPERPGTSEQP